MATLINRYLLPQVSESEAAGSIVSADGPSNSSTTEVGSHAETSNNTSDKKRKTSAKGPTAMNTEKPRLKKFPNGMPKPKKDEREEYNDAPDHKDFGHAQTGEEFKPEEDSNVSDDENDYDEGEDQARREALLASGRAAHYDTAASRLQRPPKIEKIWKEFCILSKTWWSLGGKDRGIQHKKKATELNAKITSICKDMAKAEAKENNLSKKDAKELETRFLASFNFPDTKLFSMIQPMTAAINTLAQLQGKDQDLFDEEAEKLLNGLAAFMVTLKEHKISPLCITTEYAR